MACISHAGDGAGSGCCRELVVRDGGECISYAGGGACSACF